VYWKVGSSATIGTDTDFVGTIIALASIAMQTGATLEGRALAQTAAVTLDNNVITEAVCTTPSPTTSPTPPTSPTATPTATPTLAPTAGPALPATGSRPVPVLTGTGTVLVVLGGIILFLYRRRTREI
jgi:type VI secretion system secreted protein VgrG